MTMKKIFVLLLFLPLAIFCTGMYSFQEAQRGAEQGYALAQYEYAVFLETGRGAVKAGVPEAQNFLDISRKIGL